MLKRITGIPQLRPTRKDRGQGLVEFALLLPILLLLIVGAVDMGRMYFSYMTIKNASREAAYLGTTWPPVDAASQNMIKARAIQEVTGTLATSDPPLKITPSCPEGCTATKTVRVDISYDFQMVTTFIFGSGPIKMSAYTEMDIIGH